MAVNVIMPQMGESIAEGTIVRWFKQVGESVTKDEPLLEISTDKVDAEVPAPSSGSLAEIIHGPGTTVAVETVIGVIAAEGEASQDTVSPAATPEPAEPREENTPPSTLPEAPKPPRPTDPALQPVATREPARASEDDEAALLRRRSTPLVRRMAADHNIDLAEVPGTGSHGRVTKDDIVAFMERSSSAAPVDVAKTTTPSTASAPAPRPPAFSGDTRREPLSIMRQRIAEHMVASRRTSPHVHTVFEADLSRIVALKTTRGSSFEAQHGIKLTFTPFFLAAAVAALREFPEINASLDGNEVVYHRHINLGVAVALPNGLIVPVIKQAEELSLVGLQRAITDLAGRARGKQLRPEDVQGSTFSVTNPGPYGGLYGLPIINQPNVAILSIGGIQRRPVVVADADGREAIAIRDMAYLALSFDHRLVDGAMADQFMARIKRELEASSFSLG